MKRLIIALLVLASGLAYGHFPPRPMHRRPIQAHPPRIMHHKSIHMPHHMPILPSLVGSAVGSIVFQRPLPPPPSVRPLVYINQVWVPPVYETRPVYDAFGNAIRYEQVLVRPGYWR